MGSYEAREHHFVHELVSFSDLFFHVWIGCNTVDWDIFADKIFRL